MDEYTELHPENHEDQCPTCLRGYATCKCDGPDPNISDEVLCCPNCETPNQFGEFCLRCQRELADIEELEPKAAPSGTDIVLPPLIVGHGHGKGK